MIGGLIIGLIFFGIVPYLIKIFQKRKQNILKKQLEQIEDTNIEDWEKKYWVDFFDKSNEFNKRSDWSDPDFKVNYIYSFKFRYQKLKDIYECQDDEIEKELHESKTSLHKIISNYHKKGNDLKMIIDQFDLICSYLNCLYIDKDLHEDIENFYLEINKNINP